MSPEALVVEDIYKSYGRTPALHGLSFTVPRGAFCGLFGRNGAGKSTALNIITGLLPRDSGRVTVLGEELRYELTPGTKARLAYVSGHLQLYLWMTCREHIDFVAKFYPTWDREREAELLQVFRLPPKQRVGTLSPGQYVQLQLLLALSRHPELLLLDEPGNLDAVVRQRLTESMIAALAEEQMTVLMASHLLSELDGVCDHLCLIHGGEALVSGPTEMLANRVVRVYYPGAKPLPPEDQARLREQYGDGLRLKPWANGLRVLIPDYTPALAALLAMRLGTEDYEVERLGLQDLFIALTEDREQEA